MRIRSIARRAKPYAIAAAIFAGSAGLSEVSGLTDKMVEASDLFVNIGYVAHEEHPNLVWGDYGIPSDDRHILYRVGSDVGAGLAGLILTVIGSGLSVAAGNSVRRRRHLRAQTQS